MRQVVTQIHIFKNTFKILKEIINLKIKKAKAESNQRDLTQVSTLAYGTHLTIPLTQVLTLAYGTQEPCPHSCTASAQERWRKRVLLRCSQLKPSDCFARVPTQFFLFEKNSNVVQIDFEHPT